MSASPTETRGSSNRSLKRAAAQGGEGASASKKKIQLIIDGPDGVAVTYRIYSDMPLQKLLKRYCADRNYEYLAMAFLIDGRRVQVRRSADELHLEEDTEIDAFLHVNGGGADF